MMPHSPSAERHERGSRGSGAALWLAGPPSSDIRFRLRHLVVTEIAGQAKRWHAELCLDFDQPDRSWVDVVVDAASLETGSVERDDHIRSSEFLDAAAFPAIRFRSTRVRDDGVGRYQITGDLTIRDVTREVTVAIEAHPALADGSSEPKVRFNARASVDRQAFGLHWNQDLDTGGVIVGDKVELEFALEAVPAPAALRIPPG